MGNTKELPVVKTVPDGLASFTALRRLGLRPRTNPEAIWRWYAHGGGARGWQRTPLYRMASATPPTPEELSAERDARNVQARARRAQRKQVEADLIARRQQDVDKALERFRRWASDPQFVVLDTETTSLSGHVIEVALGQLDGTVLLDTLVQSLEPVSEVAQRIHGISDAMLGAQGRPFPEVAAVLRAALQGRIALIYNARFDVSRLKATRTAHGLAPVLPSAQTNCVMEEYAVLNGEYDPEDQSHRWVSLDQACADQGIPRSASHRAGVDVQDVTRLIHACAALPRPIITAPDVPHGMWAELQQRRH